MKALTRLKSRLKYGAPLVVVSGLPRSGTSMMMQMLESGGLAAATDAQRQADEDNPKGYFELEQVKTLVRGQDCSWLSAYRGKAIKIVSYLLKELPDDLNYQVIFLRRDLNEVLASQEKMLLRRGENAGEIGHKKMKQNFVAHLRQVEYLLKHRANFKVCYLEYKSILAQPEGAAKTINRYLGGKLDIEAMAQVADKKLYRNRSG